MGVGDVWVWRQVISLLPLACTCAMHGCVAAHCGTWTDKYTTVGVKIKFPFGFHSTELKRYTVLTKTATKPISICKYKRGQMLFKL